MEKERRIKVLSLVALIVAVLGLTIAFAALSQTLTINGRASIRSSQWDVHFENLSNANITGDATEVSKPQITDGGITINNMNVSLVKPKDKVEYTVEIVNDGSITAKVEKIQMTELTEEQSKYLEFYANYSDGRSVSESDILEPSQREVVKIVIGFKEDLTAEDLPKETTTIDLSLTINYVQSADKEEGDIPTTTTPVSKTYEVGDEIALGDEHFYVISDNGNTVSALAKNRLNLENVPVQVESNNNYEYNIAFTNSEFAYYWNAGNDNLFEEYGTSFPAYVYNAKSNLYPYIQNYQAYLVSLGYKSAQATLMSYEQAESIGCRPSIANNTCKSIIGLGAYWLGSASSGDKVWYTDGDGLYSIVASQEYGLHLKPFITISKSEL